MNIRLHQGLDQTFQLFRLVAPIVTCGGIQVVPLWQSGPAVRFAIIAYLVVFFGLLWAWYRLPIYCAQAGCLGSMDRTAERASFWKVTATYTCNECRRRIVVSIFNPNVTITSGDY